MAKASTYIKDIRAQVRADHGGKVPDHLNLTIRNYANALEMRDALQEKIMKRGVTIEDEPGSMGQPVTKQHPLLAVALPVGDAGSEVRERPRRHGGEGCCQARERGQRPCGRVAERIH